MRILFITLLLAACSTQGSSQVLISLLLGDKLNTGKIEFGLDGGLAISSIDGLNPSAARPSFNLGFYFDIQLKNPSWMLHTGVLVKSAMGAEDIAVYPLDDVDLDNAFNDGSVNRKLGYFNVPVMLINCLIIVFT